MPPIHTLLQERSSNSCKGKELTPYQRGKIVSKAEDGMGPSAIARRYELPISTVQDTINIEALCNKGNSLHHSSAGLSYTKAKERLIL
jgi:hypothetical protein